MIDLYAALRTLAAHRTDELVIVPFTGSIVWEELSTRPELDLPYWGSMGKAASTGLGVALALPQLKVWVLDGDGSLLMNLGCLVTTANVAPPNLYHFVLENGVYQTTGGQPIPGRGRVDFAGLARAAGFPHVYTFDELAAFEREIGAVLAAPGPTFVTLRVTAPPLPRRLPRRRTKDALPEVWAALAQRARQP
jgi:sulfopyruvate decarboxylase subunit beta